MFGHVKPKSLPRHVAMLTGTAVSGTWLSRTGCFLSFFPSPSSRPQQLLCPQTTKGMLAPLWGSQEKKHISLPTPPPAASRCSLPGLEKMSAPFSNVTSFIYDVKGIFHYLVHKQTPFLPDLPTSLLPTSSSFPSTPSSVIFFKFGIWACYPLQ